MKVLCFILAILGASTAFEGCTIRYGRRGCHHRTLTGVLVTCDGQGEEKDFPHNLPQDTVYMSLINFRLGRLTREDFLPFTTIECLTIENSGVTGIDEDAFADMHDLHEIVLSQTQLHNGDLSFVGHPGFKADVLAVTRSNALKLIDVNATKTLHQIKTLDLKGNRIESISTSLFPELRNIQELDLSANRLTSLQWEHLHEMPKLNKLFLESNRFQTIPESMFSVFFAVKELSLANNPLHCNCKLKWLKEFYDVAIDKTLDITSVTCASPTSFAMSSANEGDFKCLHPSKPKIVWTELPDGRFEVNCSSHADPAPTLRFVFPDGRVIITPPSDDLSKLNSTTPQMITTDGTVICTSINSEGAEFTSEYLGDPVSSTNSSPKHQLSPILFTTSLVTMATICHCLIRSLYTN
ncbi:hypothetical protein CAPTEDRAFT_161548 [Capitella teleta]|uniref:LRRCT domain-containing protein n=1 Tax=Capitella teleta TaxID=283909 RepID=R7U2D7_CAPTE|nr:hypothetical protein CAPTEDRAFT_161548 [Capitella teleta]|eukprot:ELT97801.1 hypothetical protein CAPTEDRAFT_161548 [Capitella teleta]